MILPTRTSACLLLSLSLLTQLLHHKCVASHLVCPRKGATDSSSRLTVDDRNGQDFYEISGLAMSPTQKTLGGDPVLYGINDRGGGKRLGMFDTGRGRRYKTLRLDNLPSSEDWESLAIGSCGVHGEMETCVYIADTGDNRARNSGGKRSSRGGEPYRIFKVRERNLSNFQDNEIVPASEMYALKIDYNDPSSPTKFADCETVFLDHTGWGGEVGDIYLLAKWNGRDAREKTRLFRIPASAWLLSSTYSPIVVGTYDHGGDILGKAWTRADMTLDGTLIALGDGKDTFLFPRCPGTSVADSLTGGADSCYKWENPKSRDARQFETFAWTPDGLRNLQLSECRRCDPPMGWTTMDYNNPAMIIICPDTRAEETPSPAPTKSATIGSAGRLFEGSQGRRHNSTNN